MVPAVVDMAADPAVTELEMVDMAAVTVVAMAADPAVTGPEMVAMAADPVVTVVTALDKVARLKAVVEGIVRALARVPVETAERLVIVGTPVE